MWRSEFGIKMLMESCNIAPLGIMTSQRVLDRIGIVSGRGFLIRSNANNSFTSNEKEHSRIIEHD